MKYKECLHSESLLNLLLLIFSPTFFAIFLSFLHPSFTDIMVDQPIPTGSSPRTDSAVSDQLPVMGTPNAVLGAQHLAVDSYHMSQYVREIVLVSDICFWLTTSLRFHYRGFHTGLF